MTKHRDSSPKPRKERKHEDADKKKHRKSKKSRSSKKTTAGGSVEYELRAMRVDVNGAVISPILAQAGRTGRLEFKKLRYDVKAEDLGYDPDSVEAEIFEVRRKDDGTVLRRFDFSTVRLIDSSNWPFGMKNKKVRKRSSKYDSESSFSEGEGDYDPSPEKFEQNLAVDAAGQKFNLGRVEVGGWTFHIVCERIPVTEKDVSPGEYKRLEEFDHKKVAFLLTEVSIDLSDKRDHNDDDGGSD